MSAEFVYLASGSPRRRELLTQIGVPFRVLSTAVDETGLSGETPEQYVERVAKAKAVAGLHAQRKPGGDLAQGPVLAADTIVELDGRILLKPKDAAEGERMLLALSGRRHQVLTVVAIGFAQRLEWRLSRSQVTFRALAADEVRAYWQTGEPHDKAGGYAIQGRGAVFIADLQGSYSGVMGLPLFETAELLELSGVPRWR